MEQGTHVELIQKKGLYWSLYQRQRSDTKTVPVCIVAKVLSF